MKNIDWVRSVNSLCPSCPIGHFHIVLLSLRELPFCSTALVFRVTVTAFDEEVKLTPCLKYFEGAIALKLVRIIFELVKKKTYENKKKFSPPVQKLE